MRVRLCAVALLAIMAVAGCSPAVRYTAEEIKDYPMDVQDQIIRGQASPGMTTQQVRYAWGSPDSIRVLEPVEGKKREEWVYSTLSVWDTRVLLFLDGRLMYISGESQGKKE